MWARIDDGSIDHDKIEDACERLGDGPGVFERVYGAFAWAIVHCNRRLTDGFISDRAIEKRGILADTVEALVGARLWKRVQGGYRAHDFLEWNPTAAAVKDRQARDRQRKRSRAGFRSDIQAEGQADSERNGDGSPDGFRSEEQDDSTRNGERIPRGNNSGIQSESAADSARSSSRADPVPSRPVPVPPVAPLPGGRPLTRRERRVAARGAGPETSSWRDRCAALGHEPPCTTPTACELRQQHAEERTHA